MWPLVRVARNRRVRRMGGPVGPGWPKAGRGKLSLRLPWIGKTVVGFAGGLLSLLSLAAIGVGAILWTPVQADGSLAILATGAPSFRTGFLDRTDQHLLLELRPAGTQGAGWISLARNASSPALIAAAETLLTTYGEGHLPSGSGAAAALRAFAQTWRGQTNLAGDVAVLLTERNGGSVGGGLLHLRVALLAANLAWRYPAQTLLEYVMNSTYYGRLATGLDEAAFAYFGKPALELNLDQIATLTVIGQDPTLADRLVDLQGARARLLAGMVSLGWMGSSQAVEEASRPIALIPRADVANPAVAAYLRLVESQLETEFGEAALVTSGFRVTTSLEFPLQLEAVCAAQTEAAWLAGAPPEFRTARADGGDCDAADLVEGLGGARAQGVDFGVTVLQTATDELLAYFPSIQDQSLTDRSGQPGTSLLPFVYLTAFARGYSPATSVLDVPSPTPQGVGGELPLANTNGQYQGALRARQALLDQSLVPAAGLVERVGLENVLRTLSELGIYSRPQDAPQDARALLLGGGQSSLLDLTHAYAIVADNGIQATAPASVSPGLVGRIALASGRGDEPVSSGPSVAVVSPGLAYLLQDVLSGTGLGEALSENGWDEGSYAGSSTETGDSWAVFLTPDFVVGVWAKAPGGADLDRQAALPLARAIGRWLEQGKPSARWIMPADVTRLDVCDPSGLLPSTDCPNVVSEVFLSGSEPSQVDSYYQRLAVNTETGRLATLWTSPSLVKEEVFQDPPAEARPWTPAGSIPLAPQEFDTLPSSFPYPATLHITSPGPFSVVRGVVPVTGTAALESQASYVLQAGEGFYPSLWYEVENTTSQPREALLGTWDTHKLQGLVALELLGIGQDGHVASFAIPVTVDNVSPTIQWVVPQDGGVEQVAPGGIAVIQVQAQDNLGLAQVDFYLDGQLAQSFSAGPYSVRWANLPPGQHEVAVRALDWAGNETELGPLALVVR